MKTGTNCQDFVTLQNPNTISTITWRQAASNKKFQYNLLGL